MSEMLEYKDYVGSVTFSSEDEIFFGKIEYIRDLVSFQGSSAKELRAAFEAAVDDYLEFCASKGKQPDKPYKGQFQVRVTPDIHRRLASLVEGKRSFNSVVEEALTDYVVKKSLGIMAKPYINKKTKDGSSKRIYASKVVARKAAKGQFLALEKTRGGRKNVGSQNKSGHKEKA